MSKKSIGSGITRLLFGLGKKEMKVIPYNEMSSEQFEQLDRFLGKVGFAVANDTVSLTKQQQDYILNQIKQLDLYRKNMMRDPDIDKVNKMKKVEPEFKGFEPKVIEGGKGKSQTPVKDKIESQLGGINLRGDETFSEIEFIRRFKKHPRDVVDVPGRPADFDTYPYEEQVDIDIDNENVYKEAVERALEDGQYAGGGLVALITKLKSMFGKKAITTADKIDRPAKAKLKQQFKDFEERIGNRPLTEDELEDFAEEIGDNIEAYDLPQTVAERDKILKDIKDYEAEMFRQYKSGELDKYVNPDVLAKQKLDFQKKIDGVVDKAYDEIAGGAGFSSGDTKYDAEILRDSIYEQMRPGKDIDNLSDKQKMQLYDSAYKYLTMIKPKKTLESIKKTGSIDISDPAIAEEFAKFMKRTDPDKYAELEAFIESLGRTKQAKGGIATMFRPKLKDGGPPNPGRRTFLKLLGGLASIPIVGKLFKPAAKVSKVVPLKNTTTEMPSWFPDFVDKITIKNIGEKIDADAMLFKDKDLPGISVYKYDDGRISVSGQNEYYANYEIDYKPPGYEVVDYETGKAVKTKGEFEAVDADPIADYDGSIADYEPRTLESVDGIMSSDARRMEGYAKDIDPEKIPLKPGEGSVIENEVRAEAAMDAAREADDFADGGLATMFRKK